MDEPIDADEIDFQRFMEDLRLVGLNPKVSREPIPPWAHRLFSSLVNEVKTKGPELWPNESMEDLLIGLTEEVGELNRAFLKRKRGIRGTHKEWTENFALEFGQVIITLICIANREGLEINRASWEAWVDLLDRPPERLDGPPQ